MELAYAPSKLVQIIASEEIFLSDCLKISAIFCSFVSVSMFVSFYIYTTLNCE